MVKIAGVVVVLASALVAASPDALAQNKFSWDLEFDLTLPQKSAGAGPGC